MKRLAWLIVLLLPAIALAQVSFETITVGTGFDGSLNVRSADLDGDGDIDIVGAAESGDEAAWWENTGTGWDYHYLGTLYWATGLATADMDGDGDIDICVSPATVDNVSWFENDGIGNFTWNELVTFGGARDVAASDMDGDGDMDMIVCSTSSGAVSWLENIGDATNWPEHVIGTFSSAYHVDVADIDDDGDQDVAICGSSSGDVGWFANDGGDSWTLNYLNQSFSDARTVAIADMDDDGLLDIVATSRGDDIAWWQNGADVWPMHYITQDFDGADSVCPADIDMDGDMDVAAAAVTADEVAWFENDGGNWIQHTIDASMDYASAVWIDDVDQDGDPDVLAAAYYSDSIVLYSQMGTPEPDPVTLTLTRLTETIPPQGGTLVYGAHLVSTLPNTIQGLRFWTTVILPTSQEFGPLVQQPFTMTPFMDVEIFNLTQEIPNYAPAGQYTFIGHVGFPNNPALQITDDFTFTKEGATGDSYVLNPADWPGSGFDLASDSESSVLLENSVLTSVSPNPFNAATTVRVHLPQTEEVTLRVVNLLGQEISTLSRGQLSAGQHEFLIDGSEMASGVYFLTGAIGTESVSQKLVVLK
ncbi:T9SS type A sorting domain-containing protein [bacterium]|nr:T9SS type A sorting domain-containing protein [bacterium]